MPLSYLAAELRKADPDRFLLSLFAPKRAREALWALYLFNHEIAKTRDVVSDTTLGLIRLQWWRDEIAKLYGGGTGGQNQILSTLGQAIRAYDLPRENFETLIYAREFDLEDLPPENMDGLRHYADFTTSPLTSLSLKIVGESATDDEIREISVNYALLGIIRSVPFMILRRRCFLPLDKILGQNITLEKLLDTNQKAAIVEIIKSIAPLTQPYRKPRSAFLSKMQTMNKIYLKQLRKNNFDVFEPKMQIAPPLLALRLLIA